MATQTMRLPKSWSLTGQRRKFTAKAMITLFAIIIVTAFLAPFGYMGLTAFKTQQQILDPNSQLLPSSPKMFTYEGKQYPLVKVPEGNGFKEWALVKKGREASSFIDPANVQAGLIEWKGRWRTLGSVYNIQPTTVNFPTSWKQIKFGILFRNTFFIAVVGMIGTLLSSICVAYGFSRFRIPGTKAIFMVLMATIILPSQVTLIPAYIFFRTIGWGGTWWPLIIPHFFANAYNVFLLRQYFRGIPRDLDEAATIDGASPLRVLLSVIIPQSWPAIVAVAMFHFFWSWNDFYAPLVYLQGKEDLYVISIGLTQFNNIYQTEPGLLMAAAMMALALPVIIFFLSQRVFMQGIVITGVEK